MGKPMLKRGPILGNPNFWKIKLELQLAPHRNMEYGYPWLVSSLQTTG